MMAHREDPHMTDLESGSRAAKDSARIEFRGALDELSAICSWVMASEPEENTAHRCGAEILRRTNVLLAADYTGQKVNLGAFEGMDGDPGEMSHDPLRYFGVPHRFGVPMENETLARLNLLRVAVRKAERRCVAAYGHLRADMTGELNAQSSYVYCCMCQIRASL